VIVIDTSALIAIHWHEAERPAFRARISTAEQRVLPPSCYLEFVLATNGRQASRQWLDAMIAAQDVTIFPIDRAIAILAATAAEMYGRGRHRAALNFGNCLSYAVAKHLGAPLLYKGDDFSHTDIESALPA
jgi:ribonuclease VapC